MLWVEWEKYYFDVVAFISTVWIIQSCIIHEGFLFILGALGGWSLPFFFLIFNSAIENCRVLGFWVVVCFFLWVNSCFCQSVTLDHFLRGYVLLGTQNKNGSSLTEYLNARCTMKYSHFLNRVINLFCDSRDRAFLFLASVMISMPLSTYFYINALLPAKSSTLHTFFSSPCSPEITCFLFISVSI